MLGTHNIAWRKFCSLFPNIVKSGKGVETKNCPNSSFSHNFYHWLSKKIWKIEVKYFTVGCFESLWWQVINHYVTMIQVLKIFGGQTSSWNFWVNFRNFWNFCFLSFYLPPPFPLNNLENQNFQKMKMASRGVVTLQMCTKNHNLGFFKYGVRQTFFVILGHILPFNPTIDPKN